MKEVRVEELKKALEEKPVWTALSVRELIDEYTVENVGKKWKESRK